MKNKVSLLFLLPLFLISSIIDGQDTIKFETITSIKDIPHKTFRQKWMWPHRTIAYVFMKDRASFYDTNYYSSYKKKLVITIPASTRFISFELKDWSSANFLKFAPNYQYDVGISVNSKFASFLVNTGVSLYQNNKEERGKTDYKDYQFNLYGKKSTIDLNLQVYKGFYIKNSNDYEGYDSINIKPFSIRSDVTVFSLGYNHYHIFNCKKFSYRTSFAFTEHQKKSAGSFLVGGYFSLFSVSADSSLISQPFKNYFDTLSYIKKGNVFNYGINVGYIYTLVIKKKVYATLSLVQGIGIDQTSITRENGTQYTSEYRLSSKQNLRIALGYDSGKLFFGTMGMFDFYYFDNKERATFNYSYGKFRVFLGYRFSLEKQQRKLFQKLNLIDYRS